MTETPILLLCADLIFTSKITSSARSLGQEILVFSTAARLLDAIAERTELVIIDLASPLTTTTEDLQQIRNRLSADARLLAYGSHVDVDRLRVARTAGCDPVLARSEFTERLDSILQISQAKDSSSHFPDG